MVEGLQRSLSCLVPFDYKLSLFSSLLGICAKTLVSNSLAGTFAEHTTGIRGKMYADVTTFWFRMQCVAPLSYSLRFTAAQS